MLLPELDIKVTMHKLIKDEARLARMAIPVIQLAAFEAVTVRDRVMRTGRGPAGRSWQYSTRWKKIKRWQGKPFSGKTFNDTGQMWAGLRVRLNSPKRAAASFVGKRDPRKMTARPLLVDGKQMRKKDGTPILVEDRARGGFTSNAKLSKFLMQKERIDLMVPTDAELDAVQKLAQSLLSAELNEVLNLEHVIFKGQQRVRSLERKAKKAQRELARARGV